MLVILHLFYYLYRALSTNTCLHVRINIDEHIVMDIVRHVNVHIAIEGILNICKEGIIYIESH